MPNPSSRLATIVLSAVLAAAGCSSTGVTVSTPADGGAPSSDGGGPASFYSQYASAVCAKLFDCPAPKDDDLVLRELFGTEERCNELGAELLRRIGDYDDRFASIASAWTTYDASLAAKCFAALRQCGTPVGRDDIAACREMFDGPVFWG